VAEPLQRGDIAPYADGAIVMVLAREPVLLDGIGWSQHTPNIEDRDLTRAIYAEQAGQMAYLMAGITSPQRDGAQ
jgi:acetyl-CoA C-acetyltransferase